MIREIAKNHPIRLYLTLLVLIYASGVILLVAGANSERRSSNTPTAQNAQVLPTVNSPIGIIDAEIETYFVDVAPEVGLDFNHSAFRWGFSGDPVAMMGGGLCWIDYDLDGWLDLYVVNSYALAEAGQWQTETGGLPTGALYKNEAGRFRDVSEASGTALPMRGGGCVAADLNQDGFPDLYITTSRFNILLLNNRDGTFTDVGEEAAVDLYSWQTGVSVGDLNGDGLPDLFIAGYVDINNQIEGSTMGFPNTHYGLPDRILLNRGNTEAGIPQFEEVSEMVGLEPVSDRLDYEYGLGTLLSDVDQDGDLDLFVANDTQPNRLYLNKSNDGELADEDVQFRLEEVGPVARVADNNSGMGVASGDFNRDGFLDLVITNLGQQLHSVYQNDGRSGLPAYLEASNRIGLPEIGVGSTGWGTTWADFDNDTDLDLVIANGHVPLLGSDEAQPLAYYENRTAQGEPGRLRPASNQVGFDLVGNLHGRGGAVADYDNDGDLDWAVTTIGGPILLMENRQTDLNWLMLHIQPHEPGTRIELQLEAPEDAPGSVPLVQELHIGSSYLASEDPRVHFGLGQTEKAASLTVIWPDGAVATATNIPANSTLVAEKMGNKGMVLPLLSNR